jgi:Na+-driven multidrug efflux pump
MVGFRLPLAYVLLHAFGVHGAWLAMALSTVVQGLGTIVLFRRGAWLKQKV